MRLSDHEIRVICQVVTTVDPQARVFLFGSRLDDDKRGGDLDLIVESRAIDFAKKLGLLAELKQHLGDQKIDLVITADLWDDKDPFIQTIRGRAVEL